MQDVVTKLEEEIVRIPGVQSVRIVGGDHPSEIHVVATPDRSPKQVVRDVQSLASAGFGIPIDHRIVSVVQLEAPRPPDPVVEPAPSAAPEREHARPIVDSIVVAHKSEGGWVRVVLKWPDGASTEGAIAAGTTREIRARAAAFAVARAIEEPLAQKGAKLDIDQVVIDRLGSSDSVHVRATYFENGSTVPVTGSALIYDDAATAAVHALLHAVNRKLE
jgi:hypothetical protein